MPKIYAALILSVGLTGCATVGIDYKSPDIDPSIRYAAVGTADGQAITPNTQWWKSFNDPQLNGLIERGLAQSLTVAQALERVMVAQENAFQAGVAAAPALTANAQASASGNSTANAVATSQSLSTSLSWQFDLFGSVARRKEATLASLDAATEEANGARLTLIGEIAKTYIQARGYQDRLNIARTTLEAQNQTLAVTRRQAEQGVATDLDVAQISADVASTGATIPNLEISLSQSTHRLSVLLGDQPSALRPLFNTGGQIPRVTGGVAAGVPANLLRNRPDIRQAERQLAAATAEIGVAEADLYPSLGLAGNFSVAATTSWSLSPSISLPIFNRGKLRSTVRIEESQARQSYLAYQQAILEAVEEVENALVAFDRQQVRRARLSESYTHNSRAAEIAQQRYAAGETGLLTLLTSQRSFYSARDSLAQSSVDLGVQYIALTLALGGGWDQAPR